MRTENGFTLVEVLVSILIFSVGILAVVNMQLISAATNVKSRGMTEGIVAAQNKIEQLRSYSYTDPELVDRTTGANVGGIGNAGLDDYPPTPTAANTADHSDFSNPVYAVFWNIEDNVPFPSTKTVRVIVRWGEKGLYRNFSVDMIKVDGD